MCVLIFHAGQRVRGKTDPGKARQRERKLVCFGNKPQQLRNPYVCRVLAGPNLAVIPCFLNMHDKLQSCYCGPVRLNAQPGRPTSRGIWLENGVNKGRSHQSKHVTKLFAVQASLKSTRNKNWSGCNYCCSIGAWNQPALCCHHHIFFPPIHSRWGLRVITTYLLFFTTAFSQHLMLNLGLATPFPFPLVLNKCLSPWYWFWKMRFLLSKK